MKRQSLILTTTALALALASPALAGTSRGFENGGKFVRFDPVVAEYNKNGKPFRIVGLCQSACTLFLSIKNVCVEPEARFEFHSGSDGKGNPSTYANRHLLDHYNPKLRKFVIENRYLEDFSFHAISGKDMIEKFGYPACTPEQRLQTAEEDTRTRGGEGSFVEGARPQHVTTPRGNEGSYDGR
jgi:hypothetical protein